MTYKTILLWAFIIGSCLGGQLLFMVPDVYAQSTDFTPTSDIVDEKTASKATVDAEIPAADVQIPVDQKIKDQDMQSVEVAVSLPPEPDRQESIKEEVIDIPTQLSPLPVTAPVMVSMIQFDPHKGLTFLELWNTGDEFENLADLAIDVRYSEITDTGYADYECQIMVEGYMRPKQYVTFASQHVRMNDTYGLEGCVYTGAQIVDVQIIISQKDTATLTERIMLPPNDTLVTYARKSSGSYKTGKFDTDFVHNSAILARTSTLYTPISETSLVITEVYPNARLCAPSDADLTCKTYVKVHNTSDVPIDLSAYRLRNGRTDTSATVYNTSSLTGIVAPNGFAIITQSAEGSELALHSDAGATWFEDVHGLITYMNDGAPYEQADTSAHRSMAWAYDPFDNTWKWAIPAPQISESLFGTPGMGGGAHAVTDTELVPCADDQYRNLETNRCRQLISGDESFTPCRGDQYRSLETNRCRSSAVATSGLTPCKDGQYRSEETNRCRSATVSTASVQPCSSEQFRNPETGRCKKVATATSNLTPCAANQQRNPETNRCRAVKLSTPPTTAYAVEPIKQTAVGVLKWWALGGVLMAAAAYGAWEWRHELRQVMCRAGAFARGRK